MVAVPGAVLGYYVSVEAVLTFADGGDLGTQSTILHVGICTSFCAIRWVLLLPKIGVMNECKEFRRFAGSWAAQW